MFPYPGQCLKASFPNTSLPQTLTQAYKRELHKFDTQRVALAWDGLISKQQAALESLGVPAMYVTDMALDREVRVPITVFDFVTVPTFMIAVRDGP